MEMSRKKNKNPSQNVMTDLVKCLLNNGESYTEEFGKNVRAQGSIRNTQFLLKITYFKEIQREVSLSLYF